MRVALTGAHGTGKTTLAQALSPRFGLRELPTPGRLMAPKGLPINEEATVASQCLAWLIQLKLESESEDWIAMRSLVDVWAYTALAHQRARPTPLEDELFGQITETTRLLMPGRYDVLFLLRPRIPLVADDVRSDNRDFQASVDRKILEGLDSWHIERVDIDVTSPNAVEQAVECVAEAAGLH